MCRNSHYPGVFQFVIKSVEEPKDNLHIYIEVNHTIYVWKGSDFAVYFIYNSWAFKAEAVNKWKKPGTEKK